MSKTLFSISHSGKDISHKNCITVSNATGNTTAKIYPGLGGSVQELIINGNCIIKPPRSTDYLANFASSILFPFANRIKDGMYYFKQKKYALEVNQKTENNAMHGLVYNKAFQIIKEEVTEKHARITLEHSEKERVKGFPFLYAIQIRYTLTSTNLNIEVFIKNTDNQPFPFSVGWHPYFYSTDLFHSFLTMKSQQKFSFDDKMIPVEIKHIKLERDLQIKDRKFDDCYILANNYVCFKTPNYAIKLSSSSDKNFVQVFTPKERDLIAIEPITAPSNSFNNKLGIQVLYPDNVYHVSWRVTLKSVNNE